MEGPNKVASEKADKGETIYEMDYMPVYADDLRWAMECAIKAAGPLEAEPTEAYFQRVKRYATLILLTRKELSHDINGNIH